MQAAWRKAGLKGSKDMGHPRASERLSPFHVCSNQGWASQSGYVPGTPTGILTVQKARPTLGPRQPSVCATILAVQLNTGH